MKILLLGKNGQVGWELQRSLSLLGEVVALDFDSPAPLTADFSNPESLVATIRAVAPDVIVNSAAHRLLRHAQYFRRFRDGMERLRLLHEGAHNGLLCRVLPG